MIEVISEIKTNTNIVSGIFTSSNSWYVGFVNLIFSPKLVSGIKIDKKNLYQELKDAKIPDISIYIPN